MKKVLFSSVLALALLSSNCLVAKDNQDQKKCTNKTECPKDKKSCCSKSADKKGDCSKKKACNKTKKSKK